MEQNNKFTRPKRKKINKGIYLHCPSLSQFLQSPAMTFFFKSETEKHLKLGSRLGESEDELPEPRSLTRSLDSG